ncbi:unnamed protein product [Linum tenue]|uniref:Exostosin GT47 domain-containing protein n=1 Tax=Linum tenue TaxID=586396 RepID=A0AAV0IVS2_9ROSI|nr:unnamed protein product [Linum tenue]
MARKSSFVKQAMACSACLVLVLYAAYFTTFLRPASSPPPPLDIRDGVVVGSTITLSANRIKVFMYNLPRQFTGGIIEEFARARGSTDVSKSWYPGHQHMGEWHLFADLNRTDEDRVGSPVVRVADPDEAELFYVPFFSSLSLLVNVNRRLAVADDQVYSDDKMQDELVQWLEQQEYWRRNNGRDHVIAAGDPNALNRVMDRVKNSVLLLSDFGRVRPDQGSLIKDVIVPYAHRINPYKGEIGVKKRNTLLLFMGNRYRKDANRAMHTSKFCLNPAGDTPSACRLFDAIVSLCVPVILSDSIELPFEDVIDYRKIAIFVRTKDSLQPGYLTNLLRGVSTERILEFQKELKQVYLTTLLMTSLRRSSSSDPSRMKLLCFAC